MKTPITTTVQRFSNFNKVKSEIVLHMHSNGFRFLTLQDLGKPLYVVKTAFLMHHSKLVYYYCTHFAANLMFA